MKTALKILLSIPAGYALVFPFLPGSEPAGMAVEVMALGPVGGPLAVVIFLGLVVLYARDLRRSLILVSPRSNVASPNSVWWMLLIPYNFIEDFFIVSNVARSLKSESQFDRRLGRFRSFGLISGLGWCAAQIVSLLPNDVGAFAGLVAIVLWIWHWVFIRRANHCLRPLPFDPESASG